MNWIGEVGQWGRLRIVQRNSRTTSLKARGRQERKHRKVRGSCHSKPLPLSNPKFNCPAHCGTLRVVLQKGGFVSRHIEKGGALARRQNAAPWHVGLSLLECSLFGTDSGSCKSMTCRAEIREGSIGTARGHLCQSFHRRPVLRAPGLGIDVLRRTMRL